ncbi:outer membrane beta-barrel protein [Sphingobacterium sp.]|uniref:outer membrane beta-barrel protein n=1 Tax=Sphingobacterium sp. TaxID=341027 RepID=UPI00258CBBF7|nr:outer membrane beta-barrel protein [Sphingobacterium sp.]WET67009.1 MAG: outer membrane beta-barrel protein [Sphingobacterium sp.]
MAIILSMGLAMPVLSQTKNIKHQIDNHIIRGKVIDTGTKQDLKDASVLILNSKDLVIKKFTRTKTDGYFLMNVLIVGSYILYVSYPGYVDYSETFDLDSNQTIKDFGSINLVLKANLLKEVIVNGTLSTIQIKGDTTEYNAKAYHLNSYANVEDLLKRLPGIQVDQNGKISAQGENINKVLVDGEEFFGDDPTLVTRNLRSDMVDKVQLFDKKSDLATLTGINDGKTDKTLNIKLREDKKNGCFGKAVASLGTEGYYAGQLMYNSFREKRRFSMYAVMGNNGKTSLNWQNNAKYATSNIDISTQGMMIDLGGYDELESHSGQYEGKGLPTARTGGVHYDNKWKSNTLSLNTNYKIGALAIDGKSNTQTQNNIPSGQINSNIEQTFHNHIFRQKMDGIVQISPDSLSNIKVTINGNIKKTEQYNSVFTSTENNANLLLNDNSRDNSAKIDQQNLSSELLYTRKFSKTGRSFSVNIIALMSKINGNDLLSSTTNFYAAGLVDSSQTINQLKINSIINNNLNAFLSYSEPLSKAISIIMNYGFSADGSRSDHRTFNKSINGTYQSLDSLYSNNFEVKQFVNQFGLNFNLVINKALLTFGTNISTVDFGQLNNFSKKTLYRNFVLWNPQLRLQYKISQQSSITLDYNGNSIKPTVFQLQPISINKDPVNIIEGNPLLRPSFKQQGMFRYQSYAPVSGQLIGIFLGYELTGNSIANYLMTDSLGRTVNKYINLDNKNISNLNFSVFYDRKIKPLDLIVGINLNINGNTYYNISNNQLNRTNYNTYTIQTRFSKARANLYEFNASLGPIYTLSSSSLQQNINNNGKGFMGSGDLIIFLPHKFQFSTNANYQYNSKTETFAQDFTRTIINASVSKLFLKEQTLKLSLAVNDLLNRNSGFNRNVTGNLMVQNNYTTIKRYFMVSLSYDFNKVGDKPTTNN